MSWLTRIARVGGFGVWFAGQVIRANWQVASDLVTPGSAMTPGIVALRVRCRTRGELTLLSNLITLTPGTMTVEVDRHAHTLYVLGLYAPPSADEFRAQLADLESRMLHAVRRPRAVVREGREQR